MTAREPMTIQVTSIVPILHIFDIAKAGKLYQGFLGFKRRDHPANTIFQYLRSIAARRRHRYFFSNGRLQPETRSAAAPFEEPSRAAPEQTRGLRVRVPPWHRTRTHADDNRVVGLRVAIVAQCGPDLGQWR
jgi:hypothetical protein